jgi:hypothetical protein
MADPVTDDPSAQNPTPTPVPDSEIQVSPKPAINYGGLPVTDTFLTIDAAPETTNNPSEPTGIASLPITNTLASPKPAINYGGLPVAEPTATPVLVPPSVGESLNILQQTSANINANVNARLASEANQTLKGISAAKADAQGKPTQQDQNNFNAQQDWRVRLALAPGANYLYAAPNPGILQPLKDSKGVIFPYTPSVSVAYAAAYSQDPLVHSNYKMFQYSSSSVDSVTLTCDFTAQDTFEANYILAVIHFFRTMTKMFYGQDTNPIAGTPPPLCYMFGMGGYQFAAHPLAITGFQYTLPTDVDYIPTTSSAVAGATQSAGTSVPQNKTGGKVGFGGTPPGPSLNPAPRTTETTWVPTKIQLSISCLPMTSRNNVSKQFSVADYATGKLINGVTQKGTGFW